MRRLLVLLLTLILSTASATEEGIKPSYVTCAFCGQLGNQIFQIAATLGYAWDYDAIPIFPELNDTEYLRNHRDRIFFRLDTSSCPEPFSNTFTQDSPYSLIRPPFQKNLILGGFFVSWVHFHHHRHRLLEILAPSSSLVSHLINKYGDLIDNPNTVSIHVRTSDPRKHTEKYFIFLGLDYYRKATNLFPPDTVFVVFSDRINWCRVHLPPLGKNFVFIDGNSAIEDMFLMSMMKHNIIANSSFSWWAAYLNQNPNKIIVAPAEWHHPDLGISFKKLYFDDWITVMPNFNEPYPLDMRNYDARSQSIDDD